MMSVNRPPRAVVSVSLFARVVVPVSPAAEVVLVALSWPAVSSIIISQSGSACVTRSISAFVLASHSYVSSTIIQSGSSGTHAFVFSAIMRHN